jgi:hypothetical protein
VQVAVDAASICIQSVNAARAKRNKVATIENFDDKPSTRQGSGRQRLGDDIVPGKRRWRRPAASQWLGRVASLRVVDGFASDLVYPVERECPSDRIPEPVPEIGSLHQ